MGDSITITQNFQLEDFIISGIEHLSLNSKSKNPVIAKIIGDNANEIEIVFWNWLYQELDKAENFEKFFVAVEKCAIKMNGHDLYVLRKMMDLYLDRYSVSAITYLCDVIDVNAVLSENNAPREYREKEMLNNIKENFNHIFPQYTMISTEYRVPMIGRVDLMAKHNDQFVIFELKSGAKSPNSQLIAYGSIFTNPILIGITEKELSVNQKHQAITYFVYDEILEKIAE